MSYTLAEAARACGIDKSTVRRAVRSGRISGTRDETGVWHVEAVELHRVFPPHSDSGRNMAVPAADPTVAPRDAPADAATDALVAALQKTVDDLRGERDRLLVIIEGQAQRLLPAPRRPWWRWRRTA
jgi:excisionase family DNA binding protein